MSLILAGDVGGTKTNLAVFSADSQSLRAVAETSFASQEAANLEEPVRRFLADSRLQIDSACIGGAGPVHSGNCKPTNLHWDIDATRLAQTLGLSQAWVINDLEATAYALPALTSEDLAVIQAGQPKPGNLAIIAAGTGLGESGVFWDGQQYYPMASEGGHSDFAARGQLEFELAESLRRQFEHVSWERVLSGPGIYNIYRFLRDRSERSPSPAVEQAIRQSDPPAVISRAALQGECELCTASLRMFTSFYGAEAGNLALKFLATGGVYLGGGIAPQILPLLRAGDFLERFVAKGRLGAILRDVPVRVILTNRAALLGAARCAHLRAVPGGSAKSGPTR